MNGNLISLYVQHYPPPDYPKDIAIKNISPSELKNNWLLVTKENDKFKQYQIVDYDEWGLVIQQKFIQMDIIIIRKIQNTQEKRYNILV